MHKHEIKYCPRCGTSFECKPGDVLHCQCYGINVTPALQEEISVKYADCLCRKCLTELSSALPSENKAV